MGRPVSTRGFYISNDYDDLFKWKMPSAKIRTGQTVRVTLTGNIADVALKRMQTDFVLTLADSLWLTDGNGNVISMYEVVDYV